MPVQIGDRTHSFAEPTGLLSDCHRRIEMFLGTLVRVAEFGEGLLDSEARAALEGSLRYFREAAPKHTADEEESLFPRLRCLEAPDIDAVLARIDSLEQDHECADRNHAEVDRLGQLWLSKGQLSSEDASHFEKSVDQLEVLYRDHIAKEDTEVFPFAERMLGAADRQAIGTEMATRRGLRGAIVPCTPAD